MFVYWPMVREILKEEDAGWFTKLCFFALYAIFIVAAFYLFQVLSSLIISNLRPILHEFMDVLNVPNEAAKIATSVIITLPAIYIVAIISIDLFLLPIKGYLLNRYFKHKNAAEYECQRSTQLSNKNKEQESLIQTLNNEISFLNDEVSEIKNKLDISNKINSELNDELIDSNSRDFKEEINEKQSTIEKLSNEVEKLSQLISLHENTIEKHNKKISQQNGVIDASSQEVSNLEKQVARITEENASHKNENSNLKSQVQSLSETISDQEEAIKESSQEVSNLEKQVARITEENISHKSENSNLKSQVQSLSETISDQKQAIHTLTIENSDSMRQISSSASQIHRFKEDISDATLQRDKDRKKIDKQSEEIEELKKKLSLTSANLTKEKNSHDVTKNNQIYAAKLKGAEELSLDQFIAAFTHKAKEISRDDLLLSKSENLISLIIELNNSFERNNLVTPWQSKEVYTHIIHDQRQI